MIAKDKEEEWKKNIGMQREVERRGRKMYGACRSDFFYIISRKLP